MAASDEALRILRGRRFTVLFSGGADSTATLLWVLDNVGRGDWNVLFIEVTGNTDRLCTSYVYDVVERLGLSEKLIHAKTADFFALMDRWGPPLLHSYRWCLYQLKAKAIRKNAHYITVAGMKRVDSRRRMMIRDPVSFMRVSGTVAVLPILDWTEEMVLDYIKARGLRVNPCYDELGHSGGCCFCPYADERHIALTMSNPLWGPKIASALRRHMEKMARGSIGRQIYRRWMRWLGQLSLAGFISGVSSARPINKAQALI